MSVSTILRLNLLFLAAAGETRDMRGTGDVYGQMDDAVFIGDKYNGLLPIGTFVIALIIGLRIWQRCTEAIGCRTIHIHPEDFSAREVLKSFEIIQSDRHDLSTLLGDDVIKAMAMESPLLGSKMRSLESYC
jgi:hypothetical protein